MLSIFFTLHALYRWIHEALEDCPTQHLHASKLHLSALQRSSFQTHYRQVSLEDIYPWQFSWLPSFSSVSKVYVGERQKALFKRLLSQEVDISWTQTEKSAHWFMLRVGWFSNIVIGPIRRLSFLSGCWEENVAGILIVGHTHSHTYTHKP